MPMASAIGKPTADHSEYRPPTQSHIGKTRSAAMSKVLAARSGWALTACRRAATEPVAQDLAVEQGFLRAEGLGNQDAGGMRRVQRGQRALDRRAVHVGDEMHAEASGSAPRSASATNFGPRSEPPMPMLTMSVTSLLQARPPTRPSARASRATACLAGGRGIGQVAAQGGVQRGAAFGRVDFRRRTGGKPPSHPPAGQREQRIERLAVIALPGEIHVQRAASQGQIGDPPRLACEQVGGAEAAQARGMGLERCESRV
jgi:hypothetical protein